jgi:hypothetical protein
VGDQIIDQLLALGTSAGQWAWWLANSNFTTALAGAAAGAYAAQWIVGRRDRKRRLIEEIRAANIAIMMAFEIVNTFCALKAQHVRRLKQTFDAQRKELDAVRVKSRTSSAPVAFELKADFEALQIPQLPTALMQTLLFEKISIAARPLSLFMTLGRSIDGFADAVRQRQGVIDWCKQHAPLGDDVLIPLYFGLPNGRGQEDRTYPDSVEAIAGYADDCIFFSKNLMEDLVAHGKRMARRYGRAAPRIHEPDLAKAVQQNLIPERVHYADVMSALKTASARGG